MNGAFYIGATGLRAQQTDADVIAHNLANMNTVAFKRSSMVFAELVAAPPSPETAATGPVGNGLYGIATGNPVQDFSPAEVRETGNPLDLAIRGRGFVELLGTSGQTMLWRGGTLRVNEDGFLAADNGMQLKAMISVPHDANAIRITDTGEVSAQVGSDATPTVIGQIDMAMPSDTRALHNLGGAVYQLDDPDITVDRLAPGEDGAGLLAQGYSEISNVQLTDEIAAMMMMQRAYEANARSIQAGDELMSIVNGLKR